MRTLSKILMISITIGVMLNIPFVVYDLYQDAARNGTYEQLQIGTSREQAVSVLQKANVWCELLEARATTCHFSDFWNNYSISFDDATGLVAKRAYSRRHRITLLRALAH